MRESSGDWRSAICSEPANLRQENGHGHGAQMKFRLTVFRGRRDSGRGQLDSRGKQLNARVRTVIFKPAQ
jgi:hypothetical protein